MKVVIIGAGSAFGSRLSVDVLSRPPLQDSTIGLCDIDADKLATVSAYVQKVIDGNRLPAKVVASTDRRQILSDADYVIIAVAIGGPAYFDFPYEMEMGVPLKHGVRQTVGDTVGPGGIFRALRTAPALIEMARDINQLAPRATIMNYTNPMAMLTWVLGRHAEVPVIGLCHSVQGTSKQLATYIGAPYSEIAYWVAGINHMSWFLKFTRNQQDAYPALRKAMDDAAIRAKDPVRFEILRDFGYFVTESSRHMSEYVPWYQHEPERLAGRIDSMVKQRRQTWIEDMGVKAASNETIELIRSHEYASEIVESRITGAAFRFNGNVANDNLIDNLPPGCCVEVPCLVDAQGIHPCHVGALPAACAALCRANVSVQELAVEAVLKRDPDAARQALMVDPSVGAVLSLAQARALFEEMWRGEGALLDYYRKPAFVSAEK